MPNEISPSRAWSSTSPGCTQVSSIFIQMRKPGSDALDRDASYDANTYIFNCKGNLRWFCVRVPLSHFPHIDVPLYDQKARDLGWQCIQVNDDASLSQFFDPRPDELPQLPKEIVVPPDSRPTIVNVDGLVRYSLENFRFPLFQVNGELCVCKSSTDVHPDGSIDEELANYHRLRDSPYVLPVLGIASQRYYVDLRCPAPKETHVLDGILFPFMGVHSTLWMHGEWDADEKEILSTEVIDDACDIESRGVFLTDLKSANTLLTPIGLKIIDLDTKLVTYKDWGDPVLFADRPKAKTANALIATLYELFAETRPDCEAPWPRCNPMFSNIIKRDMHGAYDSVKQICEENWKGLEEIRMRKTKVTGLIQKRDRRVRLIAEKDGNTFEAG